MSITRDPHFLWLPWSLIIDEDIVFTFHLSLAEFLDLLRFLLPSDAWYLFCIFVIDCGSSLAAITFLDYKRGTILLCIGPLLILWRWKWVILISCVCVCVFLVFQLHSQFSYTLKSSLGSFIWHKIINCCFSIRSPLPPWSPFLMDTIRGELMLFDLIRQYSSAGSGCEHSHSLTMITHVE